MGFRKCGSSRSAGAGLGQHTISYFEIDEHAQVEFKDMDIISGLSPGNTGAAFENYGILKLNNVNVFRNPFFPSGQFLILNHNGSEIIFIGTCYLEMD